MSLRKHYSSKSSLTFLSNVALPAIDTPVLYLSPQTSAGRWLVVFVRPIEKTL